MLTALIVLAALLIPALYILNHFGLISDKLPRYSWFVYVVILNTVTLIWVSKYLSGSIAYPYSNRIFNKSQRLNTNTKFSLEFLRCIENTVSMIQQCALAGNSGELVGYQELSTTDVTAAAEEEEVLPPKEMYVKLASNCELLELYSGVNRQLIERGGVSRRFQQATETMLEIKECL